MFLLASKPRRSTRFPDAFSLVVSNCSSLPGIGCDSTDWREWADTLESMLRRDPCSLVRFHPLALKSPFASPVHPALPFFLALQTPSERLLDRVAESSQAFSRCIGAALSLSSEPLPLDRISPLAISALFCLDPQGESFALFSSAPGAAAALLFAGAPAVAHPAAISLTERLALSRSISPLATRSQGQPFRI